MFFGTITSLFAKIAYELVGVGRDGEKKLFRKPWMMATIMFIGMSFCLPIAYWEQRRMGNKKPDILNDPLISLAQDGEKARSGGIKQKLLLAIPTVFDLAATVLMNIGLLNVTASVYQMMRGAEMLFAALFSVLFLKRHLNKFHYLGILCCVVGIALVGMSSLLSRNGSKTDVSAKDMILGMALIVASQAVQAAQITFEDFFMANLQIAPLKIVGYEGLFGTIAMVAVMLPVVSFIPGVDGTGIHEDTIETLHMIFTTKSILLLLIVQMIALLAYNFAGMCVTGQLGAVFRTVLETMRTLFVWLVDLVLFYSTHEIGEAWNNWSYLQAAGFVVLVSGTLVYSRGDEKEIKKIQEEMIESGEVDAETLLPPLDPTTPRAMPGPATGSAPIHMRQTPSSFKSTMNIRSSYPTRGSYQGRSIPNNP